MRKKPLKKQGVAAITLQPTLQNTKVVFDQGIKNIPVNEEEIRHYLNHQYQLSITEVLAVIAFERTKQEVNVTFLTPLRVKDHERIRKDLEPIQQEIAGFYGLNANKLTFNEEFKEPILID